jgi:hypothetical protein
MVVRRRMRSHTVSKFCFNLSTLKAT